ncbi:MAG: IMP dehydrogenase [Betaproteobacteria bacterium SG8_39]|nr:MAG: IMP dehydrogenase [Betaproteobacteria bacterium SG8_39]
MSIHVALRHLTHYRYDRPVTLGPQVVRLRPAPHTRTPVLSYAMRVTPEKHFVNWQQDPQANSLARLVFPEPVRELRVDVDLVAALSVINPFDFFLEPHAEKIPFIYEDWQLHELAPYLTRLPATPHFKRYLDAIPRAPRAAVDFLVELNGQLARDVRYLVRMEPGVQTPEQTLENASGSCRDSGWLLVQLLRHLGLAARFVSGYLIQLTADVKALDGPPGPAADFTDLHAWCEVYLPGAGWIGLDPTSGLFAGEGHIPLACTPEPSSAAPITGSTGPCVVTFEHAMSVERVWEAPRVTKPYTEAQWSEIDALGARIDADLAAHDVRLTMGGEPTFVSVDDRDGAEWNSDALGPNKRGLSAQLLARLKAQYAPGGLLHYGQGKWYPGEQLPRWSLSCFWRGDGEPLWQDAALFATEDAGGDADAALAQRFLQCFAETLGLDPARVFPAYEDVWYYLWRERRLPSNVDPFDARLDDPLERARLRRLFTVGLDAVAGHVLPIARSEKGPSRWRSGTWFLRDERCTLVQGDSPIGLRLPLDSLPRVPPTDIPQLHAPDPLQPTAPLPQHRAIVQLLPGVRHAAPAQGAGARPRATRLSEEREAQAPKASAPQTDKAAASPPRTAICTEARGGVLYVFMPPVATPEDYLELVAAVEVTAAQLATPVIVEGYEPPRDPRIEMIRITPDPGVLEVNVQPARSWAELATHTHFLYDAARETRLASEKFMLDGRHSGTGGGNHVVLGGPTPADSPFLRRPDLLQSLIGYWHNHPALSFLFSGLFIGPTSQHPRIDEARNDAVYEIEIAFRELEKAAAQAPVQPWLVDRALRNLLIDASGNTHRTEFCIDKLYAPESASGRQGLVELRAFEMPPHARMSMVQQLLLRALVARFWQKPYRPQRLARWGTELHDRFMLPWFVWQDLEDVIAELNAFGTPLRSEWFAPHYEFRFPLIGTFTARGVEVELRSALEPWHVLGEDSTAGGTVRAVDSSLERLQLRATGWIDGRYVLTCNGRRVPLTATGNVGEAVAGVRYRAWAPPSALHPTIGVQAPLAFDLVDTWMDRSLGGARYHVVHPGGRSFETFPVNANEAESRRLARFSRIGHTPGPMRVAKEPRNPNFPFTLDLRR